MRNDTKSAVSLSPVEDYTGGPLRMVRQAANDTHATQHIYLLHDLISAIRTCKSFGFGFKHKTHA